MASFDKRLLGYNFCTKLHKITVVVTLSKLLQPRHQTWTSYHAKSINYIGSSAIHRDAVRDGKGHRIAGFIKFVHSFIWWKAQGQATASRSGVFDCRAGSIRYKICAHFGRALYIPVMRSIKCDSFYKTFQNLSRYRSLGEQRQPSVRL